MTGVAGRTIPERSFVPTDGWPPVRGDQPCTRALKKGEEPAVAEAVVPFGPSPVHYSNGSHTVA
ncbi:hypothetical protein Pph01_74450 [Planotetraspora phitsanulokensis]|uniref:Uncharacterized protein n=1 Tax=Planotetraspora phitsanulokensis TaxID=575192 RepID=A0A8J3XHW0_9ACTN|nr:hypothetical protein Pph01_74450 [Planotetraspora phitsanulokensis]